MPRWLLLPLLRNDLGALLTACELIIEPVLTDARTNQKMRYPFQGPCGAAVLIEVAGRNPKRITKDWKPSLPGRSTQAMCATLSLSEVDSERFQALREECSQQLLGQPAIISLDLPLPIQAFLFDAATLLMGHSAHFVFGHLGEGNLD